MRGKKEAAAAAVDEGERDAEGERDGEEQERRRWWRRRRKLLSGARSPFQMINGSKQFFFLFRLKTVPAKPITLSLFLFLAVFYS